MRRFTQRIEMDVEFIAVEMIDVKTVVIFSERVRGQVRRRRMEQRLVAAPAMRNHPSSLHSTF